MQPLTHIGRTCAILARYVTAWCFSLIFASFACLTVPFLGPRRMWTTFCGFWARSTLKIMGIKPILLGAPLPDVPAVYIANHQSILDVILLPAILPANVVFVARKTLRRVPFWGWAFMWGGAIPIERRGRGGGDGQRIAQALKTLPPSWSIVIFPEGTRGRADQPGPFRKGAFVTAAKLKYPVVPVGVARQTGSAPGANWLLRAGKVPVVFGTPFYVDSQSPQDIGKGRDQGRAAVCSCIDAAAPG